MAVGTLASADRAILDAVQATHASWLDLAGSLASVFGKAEILFSVALGVAIARLRAGRSDWWLTLAIVLVVAIEVAGKLLIPQAAPPDELTRGIAVGPFLHSPLQNAFPSGHMARVAFLVTALRWPAALSAAVVVLMAVTLVYLGDHWPSDVLGGWLLGYSVAAILRRT